jgi:hypothetical protein
MINVFEIRTTCHTQESGSSKVKVTFECQNYECDLDHWAGTEFSTFSENVTTHLCKVILSCLVNNISRAISLGGIW